jgi:pimeloyl-ACP methyl ester carboxylesterase
VRKIPFANNQGVNIHYEVEGKGQPIVFLHGLGGNLEMWIDLGYTGVLKNDYKLILIDVRGHGASDKPHDPKSYRLKALVSDVIAVLDNLHITKSHFLGYSMGGWIGFGIAKYAPGRFRSLMIGGIDPYEEDLDKPNYYLQIYKKGMEATIAMTEEIFGPRMTPKLKAQFRTNDLEALIALVSSKDWRLGFEEILPTITMPCMLFVGEADSSYSDVHKCIESIPNATFISLPNLDHVETFYRSDLVLPYVIKFLKKLGHK